MRVRAQIVLFSLVVSALGCHTDSSDFGPARRDALAVEVREAVEGLTDAMNGHDPQQIFAYFRQEAEFLYVGCTDLLPGWNVFSQRVGPYYENNPEVTFEREILQIQVLSPTVAVVSLRTRSTENQDLFATDVLVKEGGAWKVAHEHESWPGCKAPTEAHPFTSSSQGMGMVPAVGMEG